MQRLRVRGFGSVLLPLALTLTAACSSGLQTQPAQTPAGQGAQPQPVGEKKLTGTIKIGTSFALSGPYETGSKGHRSAVIMAADDVNQSGLLGDAKLEVVQEDGMHTTEAAINAYQKLIQTHKVLAVFGPSSVPQALAAIPLAQQARVLAFAPNPHPDVPKIGENIFVAVPMIQDMIPGLLDTMIKKHSIKRVGIITQKDYALAVINNEIRRKKLKELGVEIVLDEQTLGTDTDFSPVVAKIMNAKPDMVIVDGTPPAEPLLDKQIKQAGYKGLLMASTSIIPPTAVKANAEAYEGIFGVTGWMPNAPGLSEKAREVNKRFRERFGFDLDMYSAGLYDSVWLLAQAIRQAGTATDVDAIRKALLAVEVDGVQGKLRYKADRTQTVTGVIFQIQNGVHVPVTQ